MGMLLTSSAARRPSPFCLCSFPPVGRTHEDPCGGGNGLPTFRAVPLIGYFILAVAAYLVGSIPTGFLVAKAMGVDIRAVGSGNIGATNAFRVLGKGPGSFVLLFDAFKGWSAVMLLVPLIAGWNFCEDCESVRLLAGLAAVVGHNYTCWLRFKGGKGIATSAGVLLAWMPPVLLTILAVWILVFYASKYVSLASVAAAVALPISALAWRYSWTYFGVSLCLAILAIYKHKPNIQRLLAGTENRLVSKKGAV